METAVTSDHTAIISLLSLITTTIGGILIAYIALKQAGISLKQKEMDAKLEIAKIEAEKARQHAEAARVEAEATRTEARKRGARLTRNAKVLEQKTDDQTKILQDTKQQVTDARQHVAKLEVQTNGMNERLMREVERSAKQAGIAEGKAELLEERRAEHAAKNEEHTQTLTKLLENQQAHENDPKPVKVVNEEPLRVEVTEHDGPK